MPIIESLRKNLFWGIDRVKGGPVGSHYADIHFILQNPTAERSIERRQHHLRSMLAHASSSTPFYRPFASADFLNFPVIDKNIIRDNYEQFLSEKFRGTTLHKVSTSGSTGTPFRLFHDSVKRARQNADNLYFNARAGFPLGGRLYYLRIWNEINRLGPFTKMIKNIVPVEASALSEEVTKHFLDTLEKDKSTKALLAYSSTYEAIAYYLRRMRITESHASITAIFAMAEALPENVRQQLSATFSCDVLLRYSNSENGFIAHQYSNTHSNYLINTASFHVEILQLDKDVPVADGTPGRIVVTDLFNQAMPFIRYDTGDVGVKGSDADTGNAVLIRIEGRRLDFIYDAEGNMLSPHVIDYAVRRIPGIRQFQVVQTDSQKYLLRINSEVPESFDSHVAITALRQYVGQKADIDIEFVSEIPLLESGKRKIVVNAMRNSQSFRN